MSNEDQKDDLAAGGTTELTVDQLADLFNKLSAVDKTNFLGRLQGAIPKKGPPAEQQPLNAVDNVVPGQRRSLDDSKLPKLPKFSGTPDKKEPSFRLWRFAVDNLGESFGEREVKRAIHQSVTGIAAETLMRLGKNATLIQILEKFEHVFGTVTSVEKLLADFYTAQQKSSETIAEWACRLEDIVSHPKLNLQIGEKEQMLKSRFFYGLHSESIKNAIRHRFTEGRYEELLILAREAEDEGKVGKAVAKPQTVVDTEQSKLDSILKQIKDLQSKMAEYDKRLGKFQPSHPSSSKTYSKEPSQSTEKKVTCFYCRKPGHVKKNCPKLLKGKSSAVRSDQ
jgi:hypothetical protein